MDNVIDFMPRKKKEQAQSEDLKQELKEGLLQDIDDLRKKIESDEIVGVMLMCIGEEGDYYDVISAAMYQYPTETLGFLQLLLTRLSIEMLAAGSTEQERPFKDEEDDEV